MSGEQDLLQLAKKHLVESLKLEGAIVSPEIERAVLKVPRECFVPPAYRSEAYDDHPLPIPEGQTISAPHMCAVMCEALQLRRGLKVLEVGTGSGYHAALCAEVVSPSGEELDGLVVSVEILKPLALYARDNLKRSGYYDRVHVVVADGSMGAPTRPAYDRILVTAAAPDVPAQLIEQLNEDGILVIPMGPRWHQRLVKIVKRGGEISSQQLLYCIFVPLRGRGGYSE